MARLTCVSQLFPPAHATLLCVMQAILAKKRFEEEQEQEKEDQKKKLLEQYGADKFLAKKADPRLLLGQTEHYVEYSKDGRVIKGAPRAIARSKYQVRGGDAQGVGWCIG